MRLRGIAHVKIGNFSGQAAEGVHLLDPVVPFVAGNVAESHPHVKFSVAAHF